MASRRGSTISFGQSSQINPSPVKRLSDAIQSSSPSEDLRIQAMPIVIDVESYRNAPPTQIQAHWRTQRYGFMQHLADVLGSPSTAVLFPCQTSAIRPRRP